MYKLRGIISWLFFCLIVFGFWKWLQKESIQPDRQSALTSNLQTAISRITDSKHPSDAQQLRWSALLHPAILTGSVSQATLKNIITGKTLITNEMALYDLVVICDFSSYYCAQLFAGNLINDLIERFWNNLHVSFVWFAQPWQHTHNAHHAYSCLDAPYASWLRRQLIDILFNHATSSLLTIAHATEWLVIPWFLWCLLNQHTRSERTTRQTELTQFFPLTHLPSLIFYNKKTEQWHLVPWLYSMNELEASFQIILDEAQ
jgi:hypothetical protein